jgi:hypothetical protein
MSTVEGMATVASFTKKKRPVRVFLASLGIIVLYSAVFPYPLHRELVAHPAWAVKVPGPSARLASTPVESAAPFRLGGLFGFVAGDGTVLYAAQQPYGVALSTSGFVAYTRLARDWIMQDPVGRRLFTFSGDGYPLLSPDGRRVFTVKSDLSGIIERDRGGDILWDRDFPSLMTSISLAPDVILVGLLNGSIQLLSPQGAAVFTHSPRGSRVPVIVGTAVSADASLLAGMSGIDPQYLTVFRRSGAGAGYESIAKLHLSSDFRRETRIAFSPDSRWLAFEEPQAAGVFDPRSGALSSVATGGELAGIAFPGRGRCGAFAARIGDRTVLTIAAPFTGTLFSGVFAGTDVSLATIDGQLLIGWNGRLLRIDVEAL